jgi:hypothetical protein
MQLAKMIEEVLLAFVISLPVTLMVYYGIGLAGSFVAFWICYYVTLSNGIAVAYLVGSVTGCWRAGTHMHLHQTRLGAVVQRMQRPGLAVGPECKPGGN